MDAKPLIVAAHKLFVGLPEAVSFSHALLGALQTRRLSLDVVVSPSLINLAHVAEVLRGSPVAIAAQNVHQEGRGAFTGQVCLEELVGLGVKYVVIGHSEVLAQGRECVETLARKIRWCVRHAVRPIVFLTDQGPPADVPGATITDTLARLYEGGLCDGPLQAVPVVVYEPPSASICDTAQGRLHVRQLIRGIREQSATLLGSCATSPPRVLYGGGVTSANISILSRELEADGFLVGRAGTQISSFLGILDAAHEASALSRQ
jgi:triosephosphate isomerase (TIM)